MVRSDPCVTACGCDPMCCGHAVGGGEPIGRVDPKRPGPRELWRFCSEGMALELAETTWRCGSVGPLFARTRLAQPHRAKAHARPCAAARMRARARCEAINNATGASVVVTEFRNEGPRTVVMGYIRPRDAPRPGAAKGFYRVVCVCGSVIARCCVARIVASSARTACRVASCAYRSRVAPRTHPSRSRAGQQQQQQRSRGRQRSHCRVFRRRPVPQEHVAAREAAKAGGEEGVRRRVNWGERGTGLGARGSNWGVGGSGLGGG